MTVIRSSFTAQRAAFVRSLGVGLFAITVSALCSVLCADRAWSFGKDQVGTSGAAFLKIGPGARPVGMGEAYTGVSDDIHAIYWNPAGLSKLEHPELTGMHMQYFQDISYEFAAFAYPTKDHGTWGFAITNLHTSNIERRVDDTDDPLGEFDVSESAYWLSYGWKFNSKLSLGASAKFIRESLDTTHANAYAMDAGMLYDTGWRDLRFGASMQNLGSKLKFVDESDPLPLTFRVGASAPTFNRKLLLATDLIMPRDHEVGLALGGEHRRRIGRTSTFAVRSGYRTDSDVDGFKGVSVGAGATFGRVSFDFAWVPFGELGNAYRYALHVKFGPVEAVEPEQKTLKKAAKAPSTPYVEPALDF